MGTVRFYVKHPELCAGEVFFTNIFPVKARPDLRESGAIAYALSMIGVEGKRVGAVAYDAEGEVLAGAYPVFVKRKALLSTSWCVAISQDGEAVSAADLRDNVLRNIAASRRANGSRYCRRMPLQGCRKG